MKQREQHDDAYSRWLAAEIQAAIDDPRPSIPHEEVLTAMEAKITRLKAGANHVAQQMS